MADAESDVYMRLFKESLEFVIFGVVFRINIIFATTCIQLVQLIQSLVEVLQEVSFLDPLHLMIFARFGNLNGHFIALGNKHIY